MQDAKASKSKTYLFLENKKQNTFAFENSLKFTRVFWIHKEKVSGIHQKIERQKLYANMRINNSLSIQKLWNVLCCITLSWTDTTYV